MCRGLRTACSRNTRGSPKALSASRDASAIADASSACSATLRMPLPPPPATALTKRGKPICSAALISSLASAEELDDLSTGTPALAAAAMAFTLFPASSKTLASGPMKAMPFSRAALASSGFSDRNP